MYNITINRPGEPQGTEYQINGLGLLKNGQTFFVDKEAADRFRAAHAYTEGDYNEDGELVLEEINGPTVLQAFANDPAVTVEVVKEDKAPPAKKTPAENATADGKIVTSTPTDDKNEEK